MNRNWVLTTREAKGCIKQSFRYPVLSKNTFFASSVSVVAFVLSWLTLSGVSGELRPPALITLFGSFFLVSVSAVGWSFRMREFHEKLAKFIIAFFIAIVCFWNVAGNGILTFLKSVLSAGPEKVGAAAEAFSALNDLITASIFLSLWPGFIWLALSFALIGQFRTNKQIRKDVTYRLLINLPVWGMQVFLFASLSLFFLLLTPITYLPLLAVPLVTVWNVVFIFLVIVRIENGIPPDTVIGHIARVKLTLRS